MDAITFAALDDLRSHFILLNGSPAALRYLLSSNITAEALQTWLAAPGNLGQFEQLMASPNGAAAIAASSTAMAAVTASSTAMAAVTASSTAMAAVAASSTAMAAIAASSTAMAAVAASSTAMAAVAASSTAMAAIAASSTAMAAIAASSTAWAMFVRSTALATSRVPAMTSGTAPSGQVSVSSVYSGGTYSGWYAFNQGGGQWDTAATNMENQWIRYSFPAPRFVHTVELTPGTEGGPTSFRIEYSDDGINWTAALTVASYTPVVNTKTVHPVVAAGRHRHWRLFSMTNESYGSINELQFLGFM